MPKTFDPDAELPDLGGKVIVVTGGTDSPDLEVSERMLCEMDATRVALCTRVVCLACVCAVTLAA